ncbi:MAG: YajQ family cyclic di-GMP-binding protein [Bdellovibrionales bacterium]|nr:YajQ family cyclic di-GMP-binding protein [Bdellovibrionales bacterium]
MPTFDVVSEVDMPEVLNAVDQVRREIETRYDFKGSKSKLELKEELVEILADDDMKLKALQEMLKQKLSKRGISLRSVEFLDPQKAGGDMLRQEVKIKQGLSKDDLKRLTKLIKGTKIKVSPAIQEDKLRVSGKKRDDLQEVITFLKSEVQDLALDFNNFRD